MAQWFEEYPEFQANPFYISGESYAGIYVPTLAYDVVKGISSLLYGHNIVFLCKFSNNLNDMKTFSRG